MAKPSKANSVNWVYSTHIRLRNGKVIYARNYGLKAFRFRETQKQKRAA